MKNIIWITWNNHRRTQELSEAIGSELIVVSAPFDIKGVSHAFKFFLTIKIILQRRPSVLIVQNPSIILAFLGALMKSVVKYRLIVDRHTNFRIGKTIGFNPVNLIKVMLSNMSLKKADVTIVTNSFLEQVVRKKGGRGFVLPDKLPKLKRYSPQQLDGDENVVLICTYESDEPYEAVIESARSLPDSTVIYLTGNYTGKVDKNVIPDNVRLTGFLSQKAYELLLESVDVIMDFTNLEWCLVCGGYEAAALDKPLITSNTVALRQLYGQAAFYTSHKPESIAKTITLALKHKHEMQHEISEFRTNYAHRWDVRFSRLQRLIRA